MNLRRSNAIRTKVDHPQVPKSDDNLADDEGEAMVEGNSGEPIPNLSSIAAVHTEVQLDQRQYLHQVLPARTPVVPEAVHLGPGVLDHGLALDRLNLDLAQPCVST